MMCVIISIVNLQVEVYDYVVDILIKHRVAQGLALVLELHRSLVVNHRVGLLRFVIG